MAFFGVTVETLSEINKHENADRLSVAKVAGMAFQFIIPKGQYALNEKVLYFPLDALIPQELLKKMNLEGRLSGRDKNRVKTVKLRGQISMGIVAKLSLLPEHLHSASPEEITNYFGVTKYEAPVIMENNALLMTLPSGYDTYDIAGAERNMNVIEFLMDKEVVITEKMEGTNFSAVSTENNEYFVNQRNNTIKVLEGATNSYWEAAKAAGLEHALASIPESVGLYAELCGPGIQKNIYKLPKHELFPFEMKLNGKWVDFDVFQKFMDEKLPNVRPAPVLFVGKLKDYLQGRSVQAVSNGYSVINPKVKREGIVIRLVKQSYYPDYGRLIIKQRSPEYLGEETDE